MSNILRHVKEAPRKLIGDREYDPIAENRAEVKLGELFPVVSVMTDADGSKQIPIEEIFKIEKVYSDEIQKAFQKGKDEGLQLGHEQGLQKGLSEARKVTSDFARAVKDAVEQRQTLLEEAKHKILDLIIKISRKVTFDAVSADPEITAEIITKVINQLIDKSRIKVKVNPDHLPSVEQNINRFLSESVAIKDIAIEADPRVKFGGCFIETPTGDIDARLSSQFEVMEQVLKSGEDDN